MNRSCADALIPKTFCECNEKIDLNTEESEKEIGKNFKEIGEFLVKSLNNFTESLRNKCAVFNLEKVESIKKGYYSDAYYDVSNEFIRKLSNYLITLNSKILKKVTFNAQPGDAKFKTSIRLKNGKIVVSSEFNRLSKYGKQSKCIEEKKYSGICFCK